MIMAQPLLAELSNQGYQIDVLALPWIQKVAGRMSAVRDIIDMPIGHGHLQFGLRRRIGMSLRPRQYDRAIVLPNTLKSALIPYFAHIRQRTGFLGEMRYGLLNDRRPLDKQCMPLQVQRYYALGLASGSELPRHIPYPVLQVDEQSRQQTVRAFDIRSDGQAVAALCPGAEYGSAKRWPEKHYAALAVKLVEQGYQVWLLGSDKDTAICTEIAGLAGEHCYNFAGKTTLDQAMDLISFSHVAVTNDSGLMHVACALGIKTVAIYGSTSPGYTPPLSDEAHVVTLNLPCSPCFKRECPLGHLDCLKQLSVEQVLQKVLH